MSAGPNKETVFHQACEIKDASQRAKFLDQACQGDESLRAEIEQLLELDDQRDSLLDFELTNLDQTSDSFPILEKPGDEIGPFKLLQKVGEGGMGVVYMAEQKVPVRRRVALKIIKPGMDTREVVARFEAERQALAMMDHPNIAKVLDCGATKTGRPYFVMELVKGVSITQYCDANHLTPKERLELFVPVCQAIQHAHQKGIIHRDIKPSNILIAEYDHTPVPKIIDFGVAKALNQQLTEKTMFTQLGQIIGTIEYMSPEQAKVNQLDVDTRSDIYSLGVLLYELLSGSTPFDKKRMRSVAIDELMRIIREEDPPRPSTRLSTIETLPSIAANRNIEPKKLSTLLHGELDWIVMKAMEKDRGRRYDTASAFADDIQNYLNDEAVLACPPSASYRFRKFARRNKAALVTGGIVATALILGIIGTSWQAVRASQSAKREREANQLTQESLAAEQLARKEAEHARIDEKKQREISVAAQQAAEKARDTANTEATRANTVVAVLTELFASGNTRDENAKPVNYTVRELLLDMADRLPQKLKDQPEVEADVRAIIGRALTSYATDRDILRASSQLDRALKLRRELYGDWHAKTVESLLDLAEFHRAMGSYRKTQPLEQKALELSRQLVHDSPEVAQNIVLRLRSLTVSMRQAVTSQRKLELCEEAIELAKKTSTESSFFFAEILRHYALVKWQECKSKYPPGSTDYQAGLRNAETLARRALAVSEQIFGSDHPMTANGLELLGQLEMAQGNLESAKQLFLRVAIIKSNFNIGNSGIFFKLRSLMQDDEAFDKLIVKHWHHGGGAYVMVRALHHFDVGNVEPYRESVKELVANCDGSGLSMWWLSFVCELSPDAVDDWAPVIDIVRNRRSNAMDECEHKAIRGGVLLRAGQTKEALDLLTDAYDGLEPRESEIEDTWVQAYRWHQELLIAQAHHAEGNQDEARSWFTKAANDAPRLLVGNEFGGGKFLRTKLWILLRETHEMLSVTPDTFMIEPGNAWSFVARGHLYQLAGKNDLAISDFRRAVELKPGCSQLYELHAETLKNSSMLDLAIAEYTKVIELNPNLVWSHRNRGDCYSQLGQHKLAIADYSSSIELNPSHSWPYQHRANCFQKLGKFSDAITDYRKSLKYNPKNRHEIYRELGACYREVDQIETAAKQVGEIVGFNPTDAEHWHQRGRFLNALDRHKLAVDSYSRALEIKPDHIGARINRGKCLAKLGVNDKALDDYQATKNLDNLEKSKMPYGRFYFELGERLLHIEQYEMASDSLEKSIALLPDKNNLEKSKMPYGRFYFELGERLLHIEQYEMASDSLEKSIALAPSQTHYRKRAALAHFHLDQFDEAIDDLKIRVEKSPDDTSTIIWIAPDKVAACKDETFKNDLLKLSERLFELSDRKQQVLLDRGRILLQCGDMDEAAECLEGVVSLAPDDPKLLRTIGLLYTNHGKNEKARDHFSKSIKLDGQRAQTWNQRGLSYFRMGQFDKAREDFAKFAEMKPQNPAARSNQAAACFELGEFEQSIANADAALKLNSDHTHSLEQRARSHVALKHWDDAVDDYTQLVKMEPAKLTHLVGRGKAFAAAGHDEKSQSDFDQFIAAFDKAVEDKPTDWQTINRRGVAKTKIERWEQAINDFHKALELAPQEVVILKNLANCHCELGEWKSAIGNLANALELGDENWLTYYHMALCQLAADDLDGYRSTCQSMVEAFADSDESETANFTAWTCSLAPDALQDYLVVLDLAKKAWSSNQENDQYVKTLAAIHFRMGEYSVALDQLNKIDDRQSVSPAHRNSSPAYTWYLLALTHKADGNHSLAKGFLTKAKQWTASQLAGETSLAWNRKLTLELMQTEATKTDAVAAKGDLERETVVAPLVTENQDGG